ncbi:hypothetical protein HDU76_003720 [Blyttiomyces sp. JEL0837]|nr:hypothetical protein HDU76_003720 [Blyttiomyces sp. JEL0837]
MSSRPFFSSPYSAFFEVTGMDATEKMLEKARSLPFKELLINDIEGAWNVDNVFDAIVCVGVLDFVQDPEALLTKVATLLKPEGCFGLTIPEVSSSDPDLIDVMGEDFTRVSSGEATAEGKPDTMEELFRRCGLRISTKSRFTGYTDSASGKLMTSPDGLPTELKFISGYLQRAEELKTRDPVVSYYCTFYAAKLAIERNSQNKECQKYLMKLLDSLEEEKALHAGNEAFTNNLVGQAHVEDFALKIFNNADNEDRTGKASKKTAKTFLAASIFLEVLKGFGEVDETITEKIRYAKFKAVDIIKAIKEGRTPDPGPPVSDQPEDDEQRFRQDSTGSASSPQFSSQPIGGQSSFDSQYYTASAPAPDANVNPYAGQYTQSPPSPERPLPPATHYQPPSQSFPSSSPSSAHFPPPPASQPIYRAASHPTPSAPPTRPLSPPSHRMKQSQPATHHHRDLPPEEIDQQIITSATKHSKFAISALQYEDVPTAIDNLEKALALLRPLRK